MSVKSMGIVRPLLLAAVVAGSVFTSSVWAQYNWPDTAYIPFIVNVDAIVEAEEPAGLAKRTDDCWREYNGWSYRISRCVSMQVNGGEEDTLRIEIMGNTGAVRFSGTQRQADVPIIVGSNGRVAVNLSAQSYKSAEISLYAVNGKRILRNSVNAASTENLAIHRSVAPGIYLLSVKGDGSAIKSKFTHSGGPLDIGIAFRNETVVSNANQLSKKAGYPSFLRISVRAVEDGYVDTTYYIYAWPGRPGPEWVAGVGDWFPTPVQNITLRSRESVVEEE